MDRQFDKRNSRRDKRAEFFCVTAYCGLTYHFCYLDVTQASSVQITLSISYRLESTPRTMLVFSLNQLMLSPKQCVQTEGHYLECKISFKRFFSSFQQADFDPSAVRLQCAKYLTQKKERFVNGILAAARRTETSNCSLLLAHFQFRFANQWDLSPQKNGNNSTNLATRKLPGQSTWRLRTKGHYVSPNTGVQPTKPTAVRISTHSLASP